jgi:hypothetical protein
MLPTIALAVVCEGSGMVLDPLHPGMVLIADNEFADHLFAASVEGAMSGGSADRVALPFAVEDAEALAADGSRVWVVGSQSRSKSGDRKPLRERIVELDAGRAAVWTVDWTGCAACADSISGAPNPALNVEGAAFWDAHLWLGLRAPLLDDGRSLLVQLTPSAITGVYGARATSVDLGGLGVRDLAVQPGNPSVLWILAGASSGKAEGALYTWSGDAAAPVRMALPVPEDAEGLVVLADGGVRMITDGAAKADGSCKTSSAFYRFGPR